MPVIQQETPSLPVQLASEGIQTIVGLLAEHNACKRLHKLLVGYYCIKCSLILFVHLFEFVLVHRQRQQVLPLRAAR